LIIEAPTLLKDFYCLVNAPLFEQGALMEKTVKLDTKIFQVRADAERTISPA